MPDYKELLGVTETTEGLEIAEGSYKTSRGTIRIPKSRMKKLKKEAEEIQEEQPQQPSKISSLPVEAEKEVSWPASQSDRVSFITPMGTMTALYNPVIDMDGFVVLGLVPNSFVPTSYKENDKLRFTVKGNKLKECKAVFTGCKFTDPDTRATYIILMKT